MEDRQIVDLYWQRDQRAITESDLKYGNYCFSIARNILNNTEDAAETLNDTWLGAWNSLPPHRPARLSTYLGKITRRLSLKKWQSAHAEKRGGGEADLALGELAECIPARQRVEDHVESALLSQSLNAFVLSLPMTEMRVFICRYWYLDSIASIAERFAFTESKVKSMLRRTRQRLLQHLEKEELL